MYDIIFSPRAQADIAKLKRDEPIAHKKKHRLIYEIFDTEVHVDVISAYGHYEDK